MPKETWIKAVSELVNALARAPALIYLPYFIVGLALFWMIFNIVRLFLERRDTNKVYGIMEKNSRVMEWNIAFLKRLERKIGDM